MISASVQGAPFADPDALGLFAALERAAYCLG